MNFEGWLLKFGNVTLPNSFLLADGWESTPNQRTEINAYRDANILLHRETSPNYKTKITITLREMNLAEMSALREVIKQATVNEQERKIALTYWNDETLEYTEAITKVYMPDVTYKIHRVDEVKKDIEYDSFTMTFIQY
ncbi:MAG: DUF6711 family protein [Acetivibrio ethanolgignens]